MLGDEVYKITDSPEAFIVSGLECASGAIEDHEEVRYGKVVQVAKHPQEMVMQYWLKVEYGEEKKIAFVHTLMSCGWMSTKVLCDVGDAQFPPQPEPELKPPGLPDLKPADYEQEFVDPSHLEAIKSDANLKSAFPEMSAGQVKSIWRGPTGFWLEVVAEPGRTRYGAHFLEPEGSVPGEGPYVCNCAVMLPEEEEFPPEPLSTSGKAVVFS